MGSFFNAIKNDTHSLFHDPLEVLKDPIGTSVVNNAPNSALAKYIGQHQLPDDGAAKQAGLNTTNATTAPANAVLTGNYAGAPSLAAAANGYQSNARPVTMQAANPGPGGTLLGGPSMNAIFGGGTSAAAASPQSYVQAAGRTLAQQPGTGQAGTDLNNRGGYY